jgi:rubrerythrin
MSNVFSPQEILKIAIKVEENGKKLYEALEKKTGNDNVRQVWAYLKDQEEIHRKTFSMMLDNIGDYIVYEFSPGEYDAYIKAIAGGYIFIEELMEKKIKEGFNSDLEAVDFGIYIEKESILTYSALHQYVLPEKHPILDRVIDEEKNHLVKLTVLKDKIKGI